MERILPEDLDVFLAQMNKKLAKDGNPLLTTATNMFIPPKITTGLLALDIVTGGGWPGNQWIEVYGKESNGKTSIILRTISANQEINPYFNTFWVASEHYDTEWANTNGVDNNRVTLLTTNNMELAYQALLDAANSNLFDCLVLDSYPALTPSEEDKKGMDENTMTLGARRTGQFFRKVGGTFSQERPYVGFFVNQLRDDVGKFSPYGTPTTTPGGKAKNYAFYQRVHVKRDEFIYGPGKVEIGQVNKYLLEKNKAAAPRSTAMGKYFFSTCDGFPEAGNFDLLFDVATMARLFKVVHKGGSWYTYTDSYGTAHKWQGSDVMDDALRAEPELYNEIRGLTLEIATARS